MDAEKQMISNFCGKLKVQKACERAVQYYIQLTTANRGQVSHPSLSHPQVKVCICIELACRQLRLPVEKSFLIKLAGIAYKQYKTCFSVVENLLKVQDNITMPQLGVQFSCNMYVDKASQILEMYSDKVNTRQLEMGQEPLCLTGTLYKCAALVAAVKFRRGKINSRQFCTTFSITTTKLDGIVKEMLALKDQLDTQETSLTFAQKIEAKSQQLDSEKRTVKSKERDGLLWKFHPSGTLYSVYNDEFLAWKKKMIKAAES